MMKHPVLLAAVIAAFTTAGVAADWIALWNGKDFEGWSIWINKPQPTSDVPGLRRDGTGRYLEVIGSRHDPLKVFSVVADVDGQAAIRISGEVFAEMRTLQALKNYHLRLQFKWGEKKWPPRDKADTPRDSGLLYHVHADPGAEGRSWARSIELQIQEGDTGDLWAVGSAIAVRNRRLKEKDVPTFIYDPQGEWSFFTQLPGREGRCVKFPDAEKPRGEWNTIELICLGNESIHIVNGQVVMRLHSPMRIDTPTPEPVTSGPILLQSEGAEVFYRDISYRPITEIPAAYR